MAITLRLNKAQQSAVDHIYGPLLVLAGPGTGKTQLLSARIANILKKTDANASNILCLTFTDSAAHNMRERLNSIIGKDAYDVHIGTYHSFGSDIIRSYPEYFEQVDLETGKDNRLEQPIDELQKLQLVEELVNKLPYSSALVGARHYPKDVASTISELKRGLHTPESLRKLAKENLKTVQALSPHITEQLAGVKRFPSQADASLDLFAPVLQILQSTSSSLAQLAADELEHAMAEAADIGKSKPLTAWKNAWLTKNNDDQFLLTNEDQHNRMIDLASIYEQYCEQLSVDGLYDFDDMILRTIEALKTHDDLRFTLQERYQYVLLDEFQDTNPAQFELVRLLSDNPVNEGRPNLFAVGDDDQAIYAFQGARIGNMLQFTTDYQDVTVINLVENYRSHPEIIHIAHNIAGQIESRLHHQLEGIEKSLVASSKSLPADAAIERHEFEGVANEYAWVASRIEQLIGSGTSADEIVVLAPKHSLLGGVVPFLVNKDLPVAYEKRENILDSYLLRSFKLMVQLVQAARDIDMVKISYLLPQVLSLNFYDIPASDIWIINWQTRERGEDRSWAELALDLEPLKQHVEFFLELGLLSNNSSLEEILDYLTGTVSIKDSTYISPLKSYYFNSNHASATDKALQYFEGLANLSTIREHLRAHQTVADRMLMVDDFTALFDAYEVAGQPLTNTHPIATDKVAVQLMTAYKAKGLEFEHVFLLSVHDDIWGKKARARSSRPSLPANLQHIRYRGSSEDELLRILFVAVTRAKQGLYLTSHATTDSGKSTEPIKYLLESTENDARLSKALPAGKQEVQITKFSAEQNMEHIELLWESRHLQLNTQLKDLLKDKLDKYQMSPTHVNTILDEEHGGWDKFLLYTLLRFPQAPGEAGEYGNAFHGTLEKYQNAIEKGKPLTLDQALVEFEAQMAKRFIAKDRKADLTAKGKEALQAYLAARTDMFKTAAKAEVNFVQEGVLIGDAHMAGKIDRLEIDQKAKELRVVDFKTGAPERSWKKSSKLTKYKQQLYLYKLLIEGSHTWKGYKVVESRLEFVEPHPDTRQILPPLVLDWDEEEETELIAQTKEIWQQIKTLSFLDEPTIQG